MSVIFSILTRPRSWTTTIGTLVVLIAAAASSSSAVVALSPPRVVVVATSGRDMLFNTQWKFFQGDDRAAAEKAFDDAAWRTLDVPHDWSAESAFDSKLASCTAFLPCGVGWYRKTFVVPATASGKVVSIRFDGVMNHSTVWCNGRKLGDRPYGYSSFTYDLTPAITFGAENVIAVRVDHEKYADSRWYAGSGIYRNVFLSITDKVHVDTNGTFVTTPQVTAKSASVNIQTFVKNDTGAAANVTIATTISDVTGKPVVAMKESVAVPAGGKEFTFAGVIPGPQLWSPARPSMYRARTQVLRGRAVIDQYDTPFGVRSFAFDPSNGFSLNGERMKLKGVCLHHDAGALGAAVPIEVWERRLALLQAAGVNAIRCSHNPPAPEFLDLCDRMGFLVMDEAFDEWSGGKKKWIVGHNVGAPGTDGYHTDFEEWSDIDTRDMVMRDRNHPSIIMWSIGNEIDYTNDPFPPNATALAPIAERLIRDVKALDTTRPVTAAMAFPATNQFRSLLDIEGYNYMEKLYAGDHAARPQRVIFGSENSHSLAAWQSVTENDFVAGQFLWTGIDYLGEGGVWPSHGSGAGLLNLAGFPKNQYYFRQSLWTDSPMVHLSTTGLGGVANGRMSAFTNCDTVELFHDGVSMGQKTHAMGEVLAWPVSSFDGVFKAVGRKGAAVVTFELRTPGVASKLALTNDKTGQRALTSEIRQGNISQIEVNVTDSHGVLVSDAAQLVTCAIAGPARIVAIENGNLNGTDENTAMTHSVFQGRMLVYVQRISASSASGAALRGPVTLTVSSPGLTAATMVISAEIKR